MGCGVFYFILLFYVLVFFSGFRNVMLIFGREHMDSRLLVLWRGFVRGYEGGRRLEGRVLLFLFLIFLFF